MKDREIFLKSSTRIVEEVNRENPVFWGMKARIFSRQDSSFHTTAIDRKELDLDINICSV
jgi:hypothetical protein